MFFHAIKQLWDASRRRYANSDEGKDRSEGKERNPDKKSEDDDSGEETEGEAMFHEVMGMSRPIGISNAIVETCNGDFSILDEKTIIEIINCERQQVLYYKEETPPYTLVFVRPYLKWIKYDLKKISGPIITALLEYEQSQFVRNYSAMNFINASQKQNTIKTLNWKKLNAKLQKEEQQDSKIEHTEKEKEQDDYLPIAQTYIGNQARAILRETASDRNNNFRAVDGESKTPLGHLLAVAFDQDQQKKLEPTPTSTETRIEITTPKPPVEYDNIDDIYDVD